MDEEQFVEGGRPDLAAIEAVDQAGRLQMAVDRSQPVSRFWVRYRFVPEEPGIRVQKGFGGLGHVSPCGAPGNRFGMAKRRIEPVRQGC
jgi:hypothetical protein